MVLLALLPGFSAQAQPAPMGTPMSPGQFQVAPCPFVLPSPEDEGSSYRCGVVTVPVDYDQPDGQTIDLAIAMLAATGPVVADDPLLWLEGGPGASALVVADTNRKITAEVRAGRDVILVDQRGAGYSGYLDCGSYQSAAARSSSAEGTPLPESLEPGASAETIYSYGSRTAALGYAQCRDGYAADGIDLRQFRTETIARDMISVLDALGYNQATLWGTSYGGRVAMEMMRAYPERVRAAVLDSPLPTGVRRLAEFSELQMEPAEHLFADCRNDAACNAAYPDLEARTIDLIAALNLQPVAVDREDAGRAGLRNGVDGAAVVRLLTALLPANPHIAPALPKAIVDLEQGDPALAVSLLTGDYPPPVTYDLPPTLTETSFDTLNNPTDARLALSLAMRTIVLCNDEAGAVTLDDLEQNNTFASFPALRTETPFRSSITLLAQCGSLDLDVAPLDTAPPSASIPTLILSGEYDATTAPSWASDAADSLASATLVLVPNAGHATARWSACAREIGSAFVADPGAMPDTSCLNGAREAFLT
jgi:pimeloyl-ACP methyl ester carboxylesterase